MKANSEKRQTTRYTNLKPTRIGIGEKSYQVVNISREGIGILIAEDHSFYLGQRLSAIKIQTSSRSRSYDGMITHITHQQAAVVCGIRFVLNDIAGYDHMADYVKERSA